jgi:TonB family protein
MSLPRIVQALAISVAAALSVGASEAPGAAGEITDPVWRRTPSAAAFMSAYPMQAARAEQVGAATVQCVADSDGALTRCRIVCESPKEYGFGPAAMSLVGGFRLAPTLPDGRSVAGMTVKLPLIFSPARSLNPPRCDGPAKP